MEDRSVYDRRRAHLRAAGQRKTREPADRLHVRRLGSGRAGADRQGVLGTVERRDRRNGSVDSAAYRRSGSGPSVTSNPRTSSSWDSKASPARRAIAPASPSGSRACCAGVTTNVRKKPIRSRTCGGCSKPWRRHTRASLNHDPVRIALTPRISMAERLEITDSLLSGRHRCHKIARCHGVPRQVWQL